MRQRPLPERRQSWLRTATVPRRLHAPAAAAALRTMRARLVRSRPTPPRVPAQTRAPGHTGMNSNSECASFVWYLRRPVTLARSGGGWPRWTAAAARPSTQPRLRLCALQCRCTPSRARPRNAGGNGETFRAKTRRARRAGAPAPTPRSCASAARRVSGAPRRDELVRCDVRARECGGRRPNGDNGVLTATEYSRVGRSGEDSRVLTSREGLGRPAAKGSTADLGQSMKEYAGVHRDQGGVEELRGDVTGQRRWGRPARMCARPCYCGCVRGRV
jgi:hypothetical protein